MYDILLPPVVIRLLLRIKSSSKLAAVVFPSPPLTPKRDPQFVLLICDGCSLLYFLLQRAFSLSLAVSLPPSLLLQKCVISPSHHHRASKTAHRYTVYFLRFQMNPPMRKPRFKKKSGLKKRKRKRDQDPRILRNVSTFLAGEKKKIQKSTPAVRLQFLHGL